MTGPLSLANTLRTTMTGVRKVLSATGDNEDDRSGNNATTPLTKGILPFSFLF